MRRRADFHHRLLVFGWLGIAAWAWARRLGWIAPTVLGRIPLCLFENLTGMPCPGCGITRALIAAWQGDLASSWAYHPLGIPLLVVWTAAVVLISFPRLQKMTTLTFAPSPRISLALLILVMGVYVLRHWV